MTLRSGLFVVIILVTPACGDDARIITDAIVGTDAGTDVGGVDATTGTDSGMDSATGPDAPTTDAGQTNLERWATVCGTDAECASRAMCLDPWFTPEFFSLYIDCIEAERGGDDECAQEARTMTGETTRGGEILTACRMREEECGGFGGDGLCLPSFFSTMRAEFQDAYETCFSSECDMVRGCTREARPAACNGGT